MMRGNDTSSSPVHQLKTPNSAAIIPIRLQLRVSNYRLLGAKIGLLDGN
jgi:hypothetical protein